jgi:hypothetical protein
LHPAAASPIPFGERRTTYRGQQQVERGIKAALQLLKGAWTDLGDRPVLHCPLAADAGREE